MSVNRDVLPRDLADGIQWLGECYGMPHRGEWLHSYDSLFLVSGEESSLLVDAGLPLDDEVVDGQLRRALAGRPPLRYIFLTHQETPHVGGVGRLLERFPEATAIGDTRDYHLIFPTLSERFQKIEADETIDLGALSFLVVQPAIKDLITTLWGVVPERRALFCGDGFAYAHHHRADECGKLAHELPQLPIDELGGLFVEQALNWARFVDPEPFIGDLDALLERHAIDLVGPTHGLPIVDLPAVLPAIYAGLRSAADRGRSS
ncbi:MAG TPA: MBL fold metallo-hydrolase [Solirubrobacterales bacterium]|nr:MBL fold metallo-hydrolase [Solirubrobacterales bacterium]